MDHQVAALPLDLFALARWIAYAATMVTIGGGVCAWLLGRIPEPDGRRNLALDAAREITWRLAVAAPIVLIGAHLLRLYGQARAFLEPAEPITYDGVHAIVAGTRGGEAGSFKSPPRLRPPFCSPRLAGELIETDPRSRPKPFWRH